jgi:ribosomal protein L24
VCRVYRQDDSVCVEGIKIVKMHHRKRESDEVSVRERKRGKGKRENERVR